MIDGRANRKGGVLFALFVLAAVAARATASAPVTGTMQDAG